MTRGSDIIESSVDRILQSGTFRNSPTSRRLLRYLADHSLAGDADQLKEYTIGVDAFGKPEDYDPRQDSTVRIQIGRLRQKLSEYYREEGKDDSFVVDLPKGRFSLMCESRAAAPAPASAEEAGEAAPVNRWRVAAIGLAGLCVVLIAFGVSSYGRLRGDSTARQLSPELWSPELAELWRPFLHSGRPLIVAVGNPLFLQFENKALYRDLSMEKPEDLLKSPRFGAVSKALGSPESRPVHYYAAVGDVSAAFQLGQRLGPYQPRMSVVRSSQLQWQQLADANVLFLGPPRFFGDKLASLPVTLEITEVTDGFQNVHPQAGEPVLFKFRDPPGFFAEDGEACVLITHAAGPVGNTDVVTFASNSTFGRMGAIDAFTDAAFAKMLVGKMRGASGHIPQYFQVLLRVKYKGGVPTETSYILHRELQRRN
ncbi:MAG TPA: hypothetical protein VGF49_17725 [Candidatus Solibacter sp.]